MDEKKNLKISCCGELFVKMKNRGGRMVIRRAGFTIVELLMVISIIIILTALLLPALKKCNDMSRRIVCLNNQKQLGTGLLMYANDYNDWFPCYEYGTELERPDNVYGWSQKIFPYMNYDYNSGPPLYHCPAGKIYTAYINTPWRSRGYSANYFMGVYETYPNLIPCRLNKIPVPSKLLYLCEGWMAAYGGVENGTSAYAIMWLRYDHTDSLGWRHNNKMNILFMDGHVASTDRKWTNVIWAWKNNGDVYYPY